jgi:hypothetical protein
MATQTDILTRHGIPDLHLEFPELEIPILTGVQRQGDVLIVPTTITAGGVPLGRGVEVVRAEQGSNTHTLHGDGLWLPADRDGLSQGHLTVPDGGVAYLIHTEEHNALGIGPGSYDIRRQREFRGEWANVSD